MIRESFIAALEEIDFHMEGGAFRLNIGLHSGRVLQGYAIVDLRNTSLGGEAPTGIVRLDKDDNPPMYVEISTFETVELASD